MTRYSGVNVFPNVGNAAVPVVNKQPLHFSLLVRAANSNKYPKSTSSCNYRPGLLEEVFFFLTA